MCKFLSSMHLNVNYYTRRQGRLKLCIYSHIYSKILTALSVSQNVLIIEHVLKRSSYRLFELLLLMVILEHHSELGLSYNIKSKILVFNNGIFRWSILLIDTYDSLIKCQKASTWCLNDSWFPAGNNDSDTIGLVLKLSCLLSHIQLSLKNNQLRGTKLHQKLPMRT